MGSSRNIFCNELGTPITAYDADDALKKQVALRFTGHGGTLCERIEDAAYVIITTEGANWETVYRENVRGNQIALRSEWIDACIEAGRALLEDDDYGKHRLDLSAARGGIRANVDSRSSTPLPTPRTTPTSSLPPQAHNNNVQSPPLPPAAGPSSSNGQTSLQPGFFPQNQPFQPPFGLGFQNPFSGAQNPHMTPFANQPHIFNHLANQSPLSPTTMQAPWSSFPPSQFQPQQPFATPQHGSHPHGQMPGPSHMQYSPTPGAFPSQPNGPSIQEQMQRLALEQMRQELQSFDLTSTHAVEAAIAVAQHHGQMQAVNILQAIRANLPASSAPTAIPEPTVDPPRESSPVTPPPPTRKRKSHLLSSSDHETSPKPVRKVVKKPSISGTSSASVPLAKDKGKQKAVPSVRPGSRKTSYTASHDTSDAATPQASAERDTSELFVKNGAPMRVYVFNEISGPKRTAVSAKIKACGGTLVGVRDLAQTEFCVMEWSSAGFKTMMGIANKAKVPTVSTDYVFQSVEHGRLLRYQDFPVGNKSDAKGGASSVLDRKIKPSPKPEPDVPQDSEVDELADQDESSSEEEPEPKPRASTKDTSARKGSVVTKQAKERPAASQPKLIKKPALPKPSTQATSKSTTRPAAKSTAGPSSRPGSSSTKDTSPTPPTPENPNAKRVKFSADDAEWAWAKVQRMAKQDEFLNMARAAEGLGKRATHHSMASWRSFLERNSDKFEETIADVYPSRSAARVPKPAPAQKHADAPSSRVSDARGAASTQPMQVDEKEQSPLPDVTSASEHEASPTIQPDDDFERAVQYLGSYDFEEEEVQPGDDDTWPILERGLKPPCQTYPSWREFWATHEDAVLTAVQERAKTMPGFV